MKTSRIGSAAALALWLFCALLVALCGALPLAFLDLNVVEAWAIGYVMAWRGPGLVRWLVGHIADALVPKALKR